MALLARLFSPRKTNKRDKVINTPSQSPFKESKHYNYSINRNDVRVMLFRECDWRGRKLLFDSTSVEKVPLDLKSPAVKPRRDSNDMIVEMSKGYGYKYTRPHSDTNSLGETIFGSVAMATRGPSLKVHLMKDPARIMFTKIIQAPRSGARRRQISDEKTLNDSQGSSINSLGEYYNSGSFDSKQGSFEATLDDSGFGGGRESSTALSCDWLSVASCSCASYCPLHLSSLPNHLDDDNHANSSSSIQSGGSLSSLRRRWAHSVATTLDFTDTSHIPPPAGKRTKLGVAIIIPLSPSNPQEMEQFLLDRLPLVNNILTRLQHSTETAYCRRDVFVQSMFQASINAVQSVYEMLCGTRLDKPLWLTLTSNKTESVTKSELAGKLISDLSHLLATLDTKHTNFFISTLLTAVLTHHLGWVSSVFSDLPAQTDSMFADLSRSHPYNPMWAQLSDIQGAMGYPPKIAKTVVVGQSEILVQKLLSILSYFIRCGQVEVKDLSREVPLDEESNLEHLLDNEQESSFDKDAIREFSKAGSFETMVTNSTSSTLTRSKTVLSMKTFSVTDCEMDNTNSIESGFESCTEHSGESYEDGKKLPKSIHSLSPKLLKSRSSAKLVETSFSENLSDLNKEEIKISTSSHSSSDFPLVKLLDNECNVISKMESEKQFTSACLLNIVNRINSKSSLNSDKSRSNSFIKENLIQSDATETEVKENKVVFVLGENEELVNIKGQDKLNTPEALIEPTIKHNETDLNPPLILIDHADEEDPYLSGERYKTENKTDFVSGEISDRIVIVRSTPIELEGTRDSKTLRTNQLHRCLSVPEEAVSETEWVKSKRSKEMVQLVRRWLSDSAIEMNSHKPLCRLSTSENSNSLSNINSATPASVFRTSNRSLKDATVDLDTNVEHIVNNIECEVPILDVMSENVQPSLPIDEYITLPSQSSIESPAESKEIGLAASLFGGVSDVFNPELVLQGITHVPQGWCGDLHRSLLMEAHTGEADQDLAEAVCIVANTDTWEVVVVSSHTLMVEHGDGMGVRVGMSQLVANMLETTHHLCNLALPVDLCLSHVETKLMELCVRSQALAELLLKSDFLDISTLTSVLDLDANDVPLLLSVASTHTPLVTRKYGLSFQ